MKKLLFLSLLFVISGSILASAQEPNYALAVQFSAKKVNNMVFSTSIRPNWFKNSDKFWYSWKDSNGTKYYIVDPVAKTRTEAFDMERLAMEISAIVKDPFDAQHLPLRKLELKDDSKFTFEVQSTEMVEKKDKKKKEEGKEGDKPKGKPQKEKKVYRFEYILATGKLVDVTENEEEKDYPMWACISPDGTKAVYSKGYDLYWMTMDDVKKLMEDEKDSTVVDHRLTFDGTKDFYWGGSNYRAAEMKDTTKRTANYVLWSPDSRHFAVEKYDMSKVKDLWVINSVAQPRPTLQTYKYQMPGEPGPVDHLFIFDMKDGSNKEINISAYKDQDTDLQRRTMKNADQYDDWRKSIWMGDNDGFYMLRRSRDLKRTDLLRVNVAEDSARTVIHETLNTYVETRDPRLVNGGKDIIWWSERNGWAQLYLYGTDGTLKRQITNGAFHVENVLSVDETAKVIYFLAMGVNKDENPYNGHVYRIGFDGSGMKQLDVPDHNATANSFSDDAKFFVSNYSRVNSIPEVALFDATGRQVMHLHQADFSQLFAAGYQFPTPFKVKAADGITDLYGYMYKPFDFDSTKSYPIIDYVYPGPQVEGNSEAWSRGFTRTDRLAQIGFIVITVGNRGGHPNRSKWYHNFGYGNLRDYGLEDQKYAIQQLAARHKFIDINRVGIHGHSGGGFMSTAAILKYPDFFKAAVSCAGNHDNSIYNRWWSEQHHGILEEISAQGDTTFKYSIDKNQDIAKNLKGHLLLVTGDIDDNVSPSNTIRVVNALIRANKRFEMLVLPGQRHGFGDMNEYFFWRMADWYSEWLLGTSHRDQVDIRELNND
ncbi:MAG: DPP IV N-terminal domain-containing protein [Bacteroidales bacterium]|nr:DPP IV N-terminal domain-containing protein [Bacteroidales bacterium]